MGLWGHKALAVRTVLWSEILGISILDTRRYIPRDPTQNEGCSESQVPPELSGLGSTRAEKSQNSPLEVLNLEAAPQCCGGRPIYHKFVQTICASHQSRGVCVLGGCKVHAWVYPKCVGVIHAQFVNRSPTRRRREYSVFSAIRS